MKLSFSLYIIILSLLLLVACQPEPQLIAYGKDNCHHCKMTISDNRYGTEVVTKKGKVYKFDSVECMASYVGEKENTPETALVLVTDYSKPGQLTDANGAVYLHSANMPSPMGMFLTAFGDKQTASSFANQKGGKLLTWEETQKVCINHEKPE